MFPVDIYVKVRRAVMVENKREYVNGAASRQQEVRYVPTGLATRMGERSA